MISPLIADKPIIVEPSPVIQNIVIAHSKKYLLYKRIFDIVVSTLVIVFILSWLLPIVALVIMIDSKGPILFIQKRVGFSGKLFNCFKLRSMFVNSKADVEQAQKNDKRITRFGKFLRISCIDELPQFFNVLTGDMSIVGPRPHMIKDCQDFASVIDNYSNRNNMRPGITGMAQIKGYRGKTTDFYDILHRYQWDMYYVRNASLALDIKIMNATFLNLLRALINKISERLSDSKIIELLSIRKTIL